MKELSTGIRHAADNNDSYYKQVFTKSRAGVISTKLVKRDRSPELKKSISGARFKMVDNGRGVSLPVVVVKRGELKPFRYNSFMHMATAAA